MLLLFSEIQAFIDDHLFLKYYLQNDKSCSFRLKEDKIYISGLGFAMKKNFHLKSIINFSILKLIESEKIAEIEKKWFRDLCEPNNPNIYLSIYHFGGIILVLVGTAIVSTCLLYPEFLYYKYFDDTISRKMRNFARQISLQQQDNVQVNIEKKQRADTEQTIMNYLSPTDL